MEATPQVVGASYYTGRYIQIHTYKHTPPENTKTNTHPRKTNKHPGKQTNTPKNHCCFSFSAGQMQTPNWKNANTTNPKRKGKCVWYKRTKRNLQDFSRRRRMLLVWIDPAHIHISKLHACQTYFRIFFSFIQVKIFQTWKNMVLILNRRSQMKNIGAGTARIISTFFIYGLKTQ
jgi:hypothetical protein